MKKTRLRNILYLTKYLKEYRLLLVKSIVVGFVYRLLPIMVSFLLSYVIGAYTSQNSVDHPAFCFIALFLLTILLGVGRYADTIYSHDVAYRILADFRTKLYDKIEALSPTFLKKSRSGNILSIMMDDVNLLEWFYAHTFGVLLITLSITMVVLLLLYLIHPVLMVTMIVWILVLMLIYFGFQKRSEGNGALIRQKLGTLEAELTDGIHGIKDIVSLNYETGYQVKLEQAKEAYRTHYIKDSHRKGAEVSLNNVVIALSSISVLCVAAYLIQTEALSSQWYLVTVVIGGAIWKPITEFLSMVANLGLISASAGRVIEILEETPQVQDLGKQTLHLEEPYQIDFEGIGFTYPGEEASVLSGISFSMEAGETVAISGVSGSGKSTLANLLLRFYEFQEGDIKINGESIGNFSLSSIRDEVALVPQDIYLFNTSIWENVKMSNPGARDEEILDALALSGADEFVLDLPQGYDTIVGERGARLSGGQKQRIAIARAILKESKILILDEASSNLDYSNELHFNDSLTKLKEGRTTIVIAHRLSMLKMADKIVFLKDGCVDDIGTFGELRERNRGFSDMIGEKHGE